MSLAYPGPTSELIDVVGRDAFLEALGDPSLRVRILDKSPLTMEEALRIALNLEALDRSRETETRAMAGQGEPGGEEHRRCRDKFVRVATRPAGGPPASGVGSAESESALGEVAQLTEEIARMSQQMQQMQKAFGDTPPMGEPAGAAVSGAVCCTSAAVCAERVCPVAADTAGAAAAVATDPGFWTYRYAGTADRRATNPSAWVCDGTGIELCCDEELCSAPTIVFAETDRLLWMRAER